jgi:hypothetical protein
VTATADEAAAIAAALRMIFSGVRMERSTFMVDRLGLKGWKELARAESIDRPSTERDAWRNRR